MTGAPFEWAFASGATMDQAQTVADELYLGSTIEPLEPYPDQHQPHPDAQPPADLSDDERGLLIQMGLHWGYSPADWQALWTDCRDPEQRANWLRIAESEQPPAPEQEDWEPAVIVRIEGDIGSGMKQFDLAIPTHRWDEQRFDEQVSRLTDALWWRLDQPKRCADCRHARTTQHPALVRCDQRDDPPSCGMWWSTDPKMCSAWAPAATDHSQKADTEQE